MEGLLFLLECVKINSKGYFVDCCRNLVTVISLLYSLSSEYRVRDFLCFARLVDVPIPVYSFSYDIGETELCSHDIRGKCPEVHPKLFCLSIYLGQMCLHDLPSSTPLVPRDFVPGWSAV